MADEIMEITSIQTKRDGCTFLEFVVDLGLEPDREMGRAYRIARRCRDYKPDVHLEFPRGNARYNCKSILDALNIPLLHRERVIVCAEGEDKDAEEIVEWVYFTLTPARRAS